MEKDADLFDIRIEFPSPFWGWWKTSNHLTDDEKEEYESDAECRRLAADFQDFFQKTDHFDRPR